MIKKVRTRKHRRLKLQGFATMVFGLTLFLYFLSAIFLRAYNVHLSVQKQKLQSRIAEVTLDNAVLATEIQELSSKERVMAIAAENGLTNIQSNITLITKGE